MKPLKTLLLAAMPLAGGAQEATSPELFTYKVGAYEVILLPESQGQGNTSILIGATPKMIRQAIPDGTYPNAVNAFLVKTPEGNVLIDTGFGRQLTKNLATADITPDDIQMLIITHAHGDHIGGMLTGDDQPAFPKARLVTSAVEKRYWVDEKKQVQAVRAFHAYSDRAELIQPEELDRQRGDGIFFIDAPGHTPGHIACLLRSEGEQLLVWGDLTHAMAIQMPYPEVSVTYDTDPMQAAKTRLQILRFVAQHRIPVAGMHVAYPGMGYVKEVKEDSFRFEPLR